MVNILIVDDHPLIRIGIRSMCDDSNICQNCYEAGSVKEMFSQLVSNTIDLLILDISLPDANGITAIPQVLNRYPQMKILVISALAENVHSLQVLKAGAHGFISKETIAEELVNAIRVIMDGNKYLSDSVVNNMTEIYLGKKIASPHELLSAREYEVLILIAEGNRMKEIADKLNISVKTVSTHRSKILQKMNLESTSQLIRYCLDQKLIM